MLYLFLAVIFLWHGYSAGNPAMSNVGPVAGVMVLPFALLSRGSISFEARLLPLVISAISSMGPSKEKKPGKTKGKEHVEEENKRGSGD